MGTRNVRTGCRRRAPIQISGGGVHSHASISVKPMNILHVLERTSICGVGGARTAGADAALPRMGPAARRQRFRIAGEHVPVVCIARQMCAHCSCAGSCRSPTQNPSSAASFPVFDAFVPSSGSTVSIPERLATPRSILVECIPRQNGCLIQRAPRRARWPSLSRGVSFCADAAQREVEVES